MADLAILLADCRKTPWPPLGGGSARRRWGRELHAGTKVSGKGEALSLRPFGPPLPLWRKRHLPRIGGVCLPEGGFLTRRKKDGRFGHPSQAVKKLL